MTSSFSDPLSSSELPSQFDILVVGSGAAGLYSCLCLPDRFQVGLITKERLKTGASGWAQGGIAAAIDPSDSPKFHLEDTLKAGAGLCDRQAVEFLVENATSTIDALVEMGVAFDRHEKRLAMTLEAAHSHPRVLHAADTTGKAIISTLTATVVERPNIRIVSQAIALSLWIDPQTGRCQGISLLDRGRIRWIRASAVILATGGGGQVFAQTTNPSVSTGDGVVLAWRAGAVLRDLEFFQFHPTALTVPGAPRFLISEAVRGEGAHLVDDKGDRFAFQYHPAGELAPRDVVSRAIFNHLQKTSLDPASAHVYLDLRAIEPERVRRRFPNIIQVCQRWGIDAFARPIPVAPAAHYWMGGIVTDLSSQSSIAGLYAIGETASTGVHGANRLASNSLLECLVFANRFSKITLEPPAVSQTKETWVRQPENWQADLDRITWMRQNLPVLMWQSAGICRSQAGLAAAIDRVKQWREELSQKRIGNYILHLSPRENVILENPSAETSIRLWAETSNLLDIAYLILQSALFRTESRGGHYRSDYPKSDAQWQVHTLVRGDRWWTSPVRDIAN